MAVRSNADVMWALLRGHWSPYVPIEPSPKQLAFCALPHMEALYGGAAAGGKSAMLLMDALRYMDVPGYAAIIFRRSLTDLKRNGGLLDLAMKWLGPHCGPELRYEPSTHMFKWANGSSLTFGYVGSATAWEHYQGGNYQYIGWDELTQHAQQDYDEMLTRLRRNACAVHGDMFVPSCNVCQMYSELRNVPLKVRSTSNPGGRGHLWVKKRFELYKSHSPKLINPVTQKPGVWLSKNPKTPYMPAFFIDNPGIDHKTYEVILKSIKDDQRKAQMLEGDWDWVANGVFKSEWFKTRWEYRGGYYAILSPTGAATHSYHENMLRIFTVCDVACSVREGVGETSFKQSQGSVLPASWTVIGTFGITPKNELLLLDVLRFQKEAPHIFEKLKEAAAKWKPMFVAIDANGPGKPICQMAHQMGIPVKELLFFGDKPANSAEAQVRCASGRVIFPKDETCTWLVDCMGEITTWTGHPHEPDDFVDVISNGCHEFTRVAGNMDRTAMNILHARDLPVVSSKNAHAFLYPDAGGFGW